MANLNGYPSHQIATKKKDYNWVLQYVKSAWSDGANLPMGYYWNNNGAASYNEKKMYALGKQSTMRFARGVKATDQQHTKQSKIDYSPTAILCKFREQLISKMLQREYDVVASAVDELSRTEQDTYFQKQFVRITMREKIEQLVQAGQASPDLLKSPQLSPSGDDPNDMEELKMQKDYSFKHVLSEKMELGVQYVFGVNNMPELRKRTVAELFDIGLAGYKVWIDENGIIKIREVVSKNLVLSPFLKTMPLIVFGEAKL